MQSFSRTTRLVRSLGSYSSRISESNSVVSRSARNELDSVVLSNGLHRSFTTQSPFSLGNSSIMTDFLKSSNVSGVNSTSLLYRSARPGFHFESMTRHSLSSRFYATTEDSGNSVAQDASLPDVAPRIKYKRLDKTARHIMQILDKEAVVEVKERREIPDIQPGYIIELKVEIPENKRRISTLKGIVIARRNAGLNTTFRLRRLVAGVGIESLFPLYSPNIKEIKVLDKKKVRRAKLYYLRDRMNPLRK